MIRVIESSLFSPAVFASPVQAGAGQRGPPSAAAQAALLPDVRVRGGWGHGGQWALPLAPQGEPRQRQCDPHLPRGGRRHTRDQEVQEEVQLGDTVCCTMGWVFSYSASLS